VRRTSKVRRTLVWKNIYYSSLTFINPRGIIQLRG
jgi:hypothetical protein